MEYKQVTIDEADDFVKDQNQKGNRIRWQGWSARIFRPRAGADLDPRGVRNGEEWGFEVEVSPSISDNKAYYHFPTTLIV